MIYNSFNHDIDVVSEESLQFLVDMNTPDNKYNFDIAGFIFSHFLLKDNVKSFDFFYRTLFAVMLLFYFIFGEKRKRVFLLLIWLMTVGTEFIFYFIQRSLYRVVMPNYLMAVLLIVWYCRLEQSLAERLAARGISASKSVLVLTLLLGVIGGTLRVSSYSRYTPYLFTEGRQKLLEYVDSNSEKLFLAGDTRA